MENLVLATMGIAKPSPIARERGIHSCMSLSGRRRVSDPPLQGAAMVEHFGYIKCGAGQTLQGVTRFHPNNCYLCARSPHPSRERGLLGKGLIVSIRKRLCLSFDLEIRGLLLRRYSMLNAA